MDIIYLGNNNPLIFKRGVENVIYSQAIGYDFGKIYYIFFDDKNAVFRWGNIICISLKKGIKKIIALNLIIRRIKKGNNAIIHSHGPVKTLFSLYKTDILTVHDAIYYQRKGLNQKSYRLFYIIEKLAYIRSRRIHFISKYAQDQSLYSNKNGRKSIIIYNTTPLEVDLNLQKRINKDIDEPYYTLLAVRGIQERTRIDLLIDFAEYCKDKLFQGKRIMIKIAGKGPLLQHYRDIIINKQLDNIELLGYIPDSELAELYNKVDCVIITCDHAEGFGLPIIEGYCVNKPVIGSNKCAVPEIIISDNFLFENNPESIYVSLLRLRSATFNYKEYYDQKYSNSIYTSQFHALYQQIINHKKGS